MKHWIILCVAGLFEVVWAIGLKHTDGFSRLWPSLGTGLAFILSIGLLSWSMQYVPAGTAYAVWVGVGVVGTAVVGMVLLGEVVSLAKLISLSLIVFGIVGLKLSSVNI
ncbi:quaternary ammonium compound efflux SMR transporter SugE [uncultured Propionivibrio sp.]|uniref:quaternary ammonium compound efflux SMR transporter SugE n=1 Tax=uncultured Propionivibrio sp. TaxID=426737 RepID=UPI0029C075F3|nr:quaternary ammonium compound efflux SMR transporter SugE [uncultured Propionivibrio sp.]